MSRTVCVSLCLALAGCAASADVSNLTADDVEIARTPGIIVSGAPATGAMSAPLGAGGLVALRGFDTPDPVVRVQVRDDVAHLLVTTPTDNARIVVTGPESVRGVGEVVLYEPPRGRYVVTVDDDEPVELIGLVAPDVEFLDWMSIADFSPAEIAAEGLQEIVDSEDFDPIWRWLEHGSCRR